MEFKSKVNDIDCKLGTIFCQAFEDTAGLEPAFKVWESYHITDIFT